MKNTHFPIFILFLLTIVNNSFGQYHVEYKYTYYDNSGREILADPTEDIIYEDFYVDNGRYKSFYIGGDVWIDSYDSESNTRYEIDFDGEISEEDAGVESTKDVVYNILDSTVEILGYECHILEAKSKRSTRYYYYSDEFRVDPKSYENHYNRNYNAVFKNMNGGALLKYVLKYSTGSYEADAISISGFQTEEVSYKAKTILKEIRAINEKYLDTLQSKVKSNYAEKNKITSIEGEAVMIQNKLSIPAEMKLKSPMSMSLKISFGGTYFMMASHNGKTWQYNPMEDKVVVTNENADKIERDSDILNEFIPLLNIDWKKIELVAWKEYDIKINVALKFESGLEYYLINKENFLIEEKSSKNNYYLYSDYTEMDNVQYPYGFKQYVYGELEPTMNLNFTGIKFNTNIPDSEFEIPKELEGKIEVLEKAMTANEYYLLAEADFEKKDYAKAIVNYKKAIELDPKNKLYYNQLGVSMLRSDDNYGALSMFNRAIELDENYAVAWFNLGYTKMKLGDNKTAITDFKKSIKLKPSSANYNSYLGSSYYQLEEYDSALIYFKKVIEIDSLFNHGYWNVGLSLYHLERYEEAIENFNNSERINYIKPDQFNYRGICHYRLGNFEAALKDFKEAVKSGAKLRFYENLGRTYSELNDSKRAIDAFEKAIELDPEFAEAYNLIGLEYYNEGSFDAAITNFDMAIKINSKEAGFYDNRALAKDSKMDFLGAIDDYSRSISLYPDDPNIYYLRGMAKKNIDDKFDACKDLNKASELGHEDAKEELANYCK